MYGLGIRLGFYVQAACCIIASIILDGGAQFGRANSALISFALLVAFGIGIPDPESVRQLEVQIFLSLVTLVCLPTLSLMVFQWRDSHETSNTLGSMFALAISFLVSSVMSVWAEAQGPYNGPCQLLSGLGGHSIKTKSGWLTWLLLVSMLTVIATVLLSVCVFKWFKLWNETRSQQSLKSTVVQPSANTERPQHWFHRNPKMCLLWTVFAAGVWVTCVASIEFTIKRHKITTANLTDQDFGQWMSVCIAIGTVGSVAWALGFDWSRTRTQVVGVHGVDEAERVNQSVNQSSEKNDHSSRVRAWSV
jgi:hypothetical protein